MSKQLEYLDLETSNFKTGGTVDHKKLVCFAENKGDFKHIFHVKKQKENSISDLIYQNNYCIDLSCMLLHNFSLNRDSTDQKFSSLGALYKKQKEFANSTSEKVSLLENKVGKLLSLQKNIDSKLDALINNSDRGYLSKLPTKKDVEDLLLRIDQEPKQIEQETVQLAHDLKAEALELRSKVHSLESLIKTLDNRIVSFLA